MSLSPAKRVVVLARALADRASIDWDSEGNRANGAFGKGLVRALRGISQVQSFHRELALEKDTPLRLPTRNRWGAFEILRKLGEGGHGEVYLAEDVKLGRRVALKLLRKQDAADASNASLVEEGRLLASLDHPNVATVYGADEHDGRVGIWMEYIQGKSLKRVLEEQGPMGEREAILVGVDVCRALAAVHNRGLLHRDIKAQNVMREERGRFVLTDFGIGMRLDRAPFVAPAGTPLYVAPEIFEGKPPSIQSDLYAVGVLLYHLVTGDFPVKGRDVDALRDEHRERHVRLLRDSRPGLSPPFYRLVERALSSEPANRPSTAGDMERSLLDALGLSGSLSPVDDDPSHGARLRLKRGVFVLAAAATVAIVLFLGRGNGPGTKSPSIPAGNVATVAVMPFENRTGNTQLDWLVTGLTELMAIDLAQSTRIQVVPTTIVHQMSEGRTDSEPDAQLASQLGVGTIVKGSFDGAASGLQVVVRAIDSNGSVVARKTVQGRLSEDLFAMMDQLSLAVRQSLVPKPGQEELLDLELSDVTTASAEAYRYYAEGLSLQYRGKLLECVPLYEKAIQIDPTFALALSKLSILSGVSGDIEQALQYSTRAMLELDHVSPRERYYIEGNHYSWREETYGQAMASYERAVELYPDHWPARHNLGIMYWELERYPKAIENFEATRSGRPELLALYRPLALSYTGLGDFESAHAVLDDLVTRSGGSATAYGELGDFLTLWGRQEEALEAYSRARQAPPRFFEIESHLWRIHVLKEDWSALDEWIRDQSGSEPSRDQALAISLAMLYRGRSRDALLVLSRLEQESRLDRTQAAAYVMAANVLLDTGKPAEAIERARWAQQSGRGDLGEWQGLFIDSLASATLGDWQRAEGLAGQLASRTAGLSTLREKCRDDLLLGMLALKRGDVELALQRLKAARSFLPVKGFWSPQQASLHIPVWYASAEAHLALGDRASAESYLRQILESHGERLPWPVYYARSRSLLARILEEQGDLEGARRLDKLFVDQWGLGDIDTHLILESKSKL
jgi:serine/threonine protein kinase/tetratricopeptide (TPR) repeat protein